MPILEPVNVHCLKFSPDPDPNYIKAFRIVFHYNPPS